MNIITTYYLGTAWQHYGTGLAFGLAQVWLSARECYFITSNGKSLPCLWLHHQAV